MPLGGWNEVLQGRKFAGCKTDHPFYEVESGNLFRDSMLDLKPRINFQKVKPLFGVVVDELNSARRSIIQDFSELHCCGKKLPSYLRRDAGRRGLFNDLLVSSLNRTIPFADGNDVSVAIAEDLDLNMARGFDEFFDINSALVEVTSTEK